MLYRASAEKRRNTDRVIASIVCLVDLASKILIMSSCIRKLIGHYRFCLLIFFMLGATECLSGMDMFIKSVLRGMHIPD